MILSASDIAAAISFGHIEIDPYDQSRLNPASYDLTLGDEVAIYTAVERDDRELGLVRELGGRQKKRLLDSYVEQTISRFRMSPGGFVVEPGELYLMHTAERVHTRKYVSVLDGKSSIGRLGLLVHLTAGYGDPGFNGQYTLEVTSVAHPVRIYPGMRFCQMRFHTLQSSAPDYRTQGNYTGEGAKGPVRSASWRQFDKGPDDRKDDS